MYICKLAHEHLGNKLRPRRWKRKMAVKMQLRHFRSKLTFRPFRKFCHSNQQTDRPTVQQKVMRAHREVTFPKTAKK